MKATKLTPKIKELIKTEFGSNYYNNNNNDIYFHYPNYFTNKGFKNGHHLLNEVEPNYTIVSEQEFLDEFNWQPKRGEMVLFRDYNNSDWEERIFVNYTEGAMFPYQTVASGQEEKFKNNEPFNTTLWMQCKRIEAEKRLNLKIKKQ